MPFIKKLFPVVLKLVKLIEAMAIHPATSALHFQQAQ